MSGIFTDAVLAEVVDAVNRYSTTVSAEVDHQGRLIVTGSEERGWMNTTVHSVILKEERR